MKLTPSNLKYDEMRRIVLNRILSGDGPGQFRTILNNVAKFLVDNKFCNQTDTYRSIVSRSEYDMADEDANLVNEIVWDLIIERVLAIGLNSANPEWPFLRLTEYGKSLVDSGEEAIIHDVDGMIGILKSNIPQCDKIIISYFIECLETYRINALLASSVMLGCAAEKLICVFFDAYLNWLEHISKKEHDNLAKAESYNIAKKFTKLTESIKSHKEKIDFSLMEDYDLIVNSIFTIIRKNRNDTGHPTGKHISRDELRLMVYVFIKHCGRVYSLISFFLENAN